MTIAFDTNVLLDLILRRPGFQPALELARSVADEETIGLISANSITDIYYIARKSIGDSGAREAVADILALFDVAPVDGDVCSVALGLPMEDYEDAVLAACALREGADYIASSDRGFIRSESPVPVQTPDELMALIGRA